MTTKNAATENPVTITTQQVPEPKYKDEPVSITLKPSYFGLKQGGARGVRQVTLADQAKRQGNTTFSMKYLDEMHKRLGVTHTTAGFIKQFSEHMTIQTVKKVTNQEAIDKANAKLAAGKALADELAKLMTK